MSASQSAAQAQSETPFSHRHAAGGGESNDTEMVAKGLALPLAPRPTRGGGDDRDECSRIAWSVAATQRMHEELVGCVRFVG